MKFTTRLTSLSVALVAVLAVLLIPATAANADVSAGPGQTVGARTFCDSTTHTLQYRTARATSSDTIVLHRVWLYTKNSGWRLWTDWEYAPDTTAVLDLSGFSGQTVWTYTDFASYPSYAPLLVTKGSEYGTYYRWTGSKWATSSGCRV